jgi:hypothetical protein
MGFCTLLSKRMAIKMSNETTKNFLQVMSTFEWPEPVAVSYRLYYNDNGTPKCYSMEHMPGKYIEVDRETYVLSPWHVRVVDNKLHFIKPVVTIQQLCPDNAQGTPCHKLDVCVVVDLDQSHTKWNTVTNEIN